MCTTKKRNQGRLDVFSSFQVNCLCTVTWIARKWGVYHPASCSKLKIKVTLFCLLFCWVNLDMVKSFIFPHILLSPERKKLLPTIQVSTNTPSLMGLPVNIYTSPVNVSISQKEISFVKFCQTVLFIINALPLINAPNVFHHRNTIFQYFSNKLPLFFPKCHTEAIFIE